MFDNLDKFFMLSGQIDWLNRTFPGAIHKCPYKVSYKYVMYFLSLSFQEKLQTFKIYNATVPQGHTIEEGRNNRWQLMPNGLFKNKVTMYKEFGEMIGQVTFYFEFKLQNHDHQW